MPERTEDLWWLFSRQTVCITQNENVLNAAILMQKRNFRHLPVIRESGRITGILSAQDIIDSVALALGPRAEPSKVVDSMLIPVYRIMSLHPIVVEKGDGLSEVVKKLIAHNIGALPVVEEKGVVQGIITLRDLVGLLGTGSEPLNAKVSEIMTKKVRSVGPESTIADAARLMSEIRVRRLPVVSDSGELIGMLSSKDILKIVAQLVGGEKMGAAFDKKVSEIMTQEVLRIDEEDDVRIAASKMMIFGIGGLAVEGTTQGLVGLVTERDLVKRLCEVRSVNYLVQSMKFELELQSKT